MHEPLAFEETSPLPTKVEKGRPLVYLAEDDADLRTLLSEGLRRAGFCVFTAGSGREILRLLSMASRHEIEPPDAIVMDVRMPGCSGLDVLGALRLASWDQPIVMITGFGDAPLHARAADRGASVVLDKPFALEDLVAIVDMLLLFSKEEEDLEEEPPTLRSQSLAQSQNPAVELY